MRYAATVILIALMIGAPAKAASEKTALACEISDTVGLFNAENKWKPAVFPPGDFLLGNKKKFILGVQDNKITEESANSVLMTNFSSCKSREDVNMTFCINPIGDSIIYSLKDKKGSISFGSMNGPDMRVHVSVFICQRF